MKEANTVRKFLHINECNYHHFIHSYRYRIEDYPLYILYFLLQIQKALLDQLVYTIIDIQLKRKIVQFRLSLS